MRGRPNRNHHAKNPHAGSLLASMQIVVGVPDGMGAFLKDDSTVRIVVQSKSAADAPRHVSDHIYANAAQVFPSVPPPLPSLNILKVSHTGLSLGTRATRTSSTRPRALRPPSPAPMCSTLITTVMVRDQHQRPHPKAAPKQTSPLSIKVTA